MSDQEPLDHPPVILKGFRYYVGMCFFIIGLVLPLFGFFVPSLGLSRTASAAVIAFLTAGGPELALVMAAVLWGKKTLNDIKGRLLGFVAHQILLRPVTKLEYYFGLTVNLASIVPLYVHAYFPQVLPFDPNSNQRLYFLLSFDVVFFLSFFFLGGQFWEKLRRIFVYDPEPSVELGPFKGEQTYGN